jgi:DNA mismatch endonuclease, patch repair protein
MDPLSAAERSAQMSRIRSTNTGPERRVRALLDSAGYTYDINRKDLPGTPDVVFEKQRTVVFVHGCFWHMHRNCPNARVPKARTDFWLEKLNANRRRDARTARRLRKEGWRVATIWECQVRNANRLRSRFARMLDL